MAGVDGGPSTVVSRLSATAHVDLAQAVVAHHHLVNRHGVEQFVGDEHTFEGLRECRGARDQPIGDIAERLPLRGSGCGAGFDKVQANGLVERGVALARGAKDIGGQATAAGAGFDEVNVDWQPSTVDCRLEQFSHLGHLNCEELAEQRSDIDAGKKIARAARPLGRAGVVAELGIVERQIHERGHRQRGPRARTRSSINLQSSIVNLQSFFTGTNNSF